MHVAGGDTEHRHDELASRAEGPGRLEHSVRGNVETVGSECSGGFCGMGCE